MPAPSSEYRRGSSDDDGDVRGSQSRAPGRSTLTSKLPATTRPAPAPAPAPQPQQSRGGGTTEHEDPFALHLVGSPGSTETAAAKEKKSAAAPTVELAMTDTSFVKVAPITVLVQGAPNSKAVVYLTHYFHGKVRHDFHLDVDLDENGSGFAIPMIPIESDVGHHAVHVRASSQPGVFSALRVAEFESGYETYGGGV